MGAMALFCSASASFAVRSVQVKRGTPLYKTADAAVEAKKTIRDLLTLSVGRIAVNNKLPIYSPTRYGNFWINRDSVLGSPELLVAERPEPVATESGSVAEVATESGSAPVLTSISNYTIKGL